MDIRRKDDSLDEHELTINDIKIAKKDARSSTAIGFRELSKQNLYLQMQTPSLKVLILVYENL